MHILTVVALSLFMVAGLIVWKVSKDHLERKRKHKRQINNWRWYL